MERFTSELQIILQEELMNTAKDSIKASQKSMASKSSFGTRNSQTAEEAITFEKRLKGWKRDWKKQLIEKMNPEWRDLYDDLQK